MGFTILTPDKHDFRPPSWRPEEPARRIVELPLHAHMRHSRAHLWRYPPGVKGRLHKEYSQEEVFVVVEPGTPLRWQNDSDADALIFAYGAPAESKSEILES